MRNSMRMDENPLNYSTPSVIQETRAHFDSLLRKAAVRGDQSNSTKLSEELSIQELSPQHRLSSENETHQQVRKVRKKKHHRSSKQKLIDPDDDYSHTDEDKIASNNERYKPQQISNDVIVHCNPGFTSDSDSQESSYNQQEKTENVKEVHTNVKKIKSDPFRIDSSSLDSSPSNLSKQNVSLKSPDKKIDELWPAASTAEKTENKDILNDSKQPTPPPRSKEIFGKMSIMQRLPKLGLHFSQSTLSSHVSSEDSVQTAVHVSPAKKQADDQDLPQDNERIGKAPEVKIVGPQQDKPEENIELKPLTGWTPSYEEINESGLSSPSRAIDKPRLQKPEVEKKQSGNSIQSYDEIDEDSENEVTSKDRSQKTARRKSKSKQSLTTEENVPTAKIKRTKHDLESRRVNQEDSQSEDDIDENPQNAHYNYDQVLGILIHQCDRLQVDSLIIHPVVRIHVIDVATGKYLKKSSKNRCYSYEEQSDIDFIQPTSTQPCNFASFRSRNPTWEETVVINEDIQYVTAKGMNVILLFEINDFVSFEMASLQYKKLGPEGGWHRIAWAFLKLIASNGSSNLNERLRLQLFKPAPGKRAKTSNEKCDVYQHWLKGSRSRYPATLHVTIRGVNPGGNVATPRDIPCHNLGNGDVLSPTLALPTDQDHDSAIEHENQQDTKDDVDQAKISEVISWSRIPGQTCKIPNEKSLTLSVGSLGCFCLRFSPCGRFLAADSANHNSHSLLIYGIPSGSLIKRFHGHQGLIYDLQWSTGSKFILTASADCTACVWEVETALVKLLPHPSFVYSASFFHGEDEALRLLTGCCDNVLRVWWRSDKHSDFLLAHELRGHEGYITSICHDESGKFFSADSEGKIHVWSSKESDLSLITEIKIRELRGVAISRIVVHPGRQRLLIHSRDSTLRMINIATGSPIQWFSGATNNRLQTGATLSPCGRLVLSASEDGTFWAWNADTGKQIALYSDMIKRSPKLRAVLPLSGTVDYHPHEHMAAFSVYGKHAPIVVCVYAKNSSGKSVGLQLMSGNTKEQSAVLSKEAISDWLKLGTKKPEAGDSKGFYVTRVDRLVDPVKSVHPYEGSLAGIIQQMDEVIALTRRSNSSSVSPSTGTEASPPRKIPETSHLPRLTRVSESRVSSRSSSSTGSSRRNSRDVLEEHQIKRRHSGLETRQESIGTTPEISRPTHVTRNSPIVVSEVAPRVSIVETVDNSAGNGKFISNRNTPNKAKNVREHVLSVSSFSDSDSHVVDLTEILH